MRVPAGARLIGAGLLSVVLSGCGLISDPAVRLLTDRPEMAAYAERFNAVQDEHRLEIAYVESPWKSVLSGVQADLAAGEWLATPEIMERFESTADIVKSGKIDPSQFYAGLLAMGSRDGRPVLLPISFDLPTIVYAESQASPEMPSMLISMDLLRSRSQSFTKPGRSGLASMGFSPFWNRDFLGTASALFGARFKAGRSGLPAWDPDGLARTVDFLRSWLDEVNGGKDLDAAFAEKHLVQPYYKLIEAKKILFSLTSFTDFLALPEEKRRNLNFRWPSVEGLVPVREDVLFAGVLRSGKNKKGAKAFLEWFFALQNQKACLDLAQSLRIGVFGLTDGFSSIKSVNERELTQKYPVLLGHIPSDSMLLFPEILPNDWHDVREEAVNKWLIGSARGEETETLADRLEEWHSESRK